MLLLGTKPTIMSGMISQYFQGLFLESEARWAACA